VIKFIKTQKGTSKYTRSINEKTLNQKKIKDKKKKKKEEKKRKGHEN
jgi:hypothetical protein